MSKLPKKAEEGNRGYVLNEILKKKKKKKMINGSTMKSHKSLIYSGLIIVTEVPLDKLLQPTPQICSGLVSKLLLCQTYIRMCIHHIPIPGHWRCNSPGFHLQQPLQYAYKTPYFHWRCVPRLYTLNWAGLIFFPPLPVLFSAVSNAAKQPFTISSM